MIGHKYKKVLLLFVFSSFFALNSETLANLMGKFQVSRHTTKIDQRRLVGSASRSGECKQNLTSNSIELLVPNLAQAHQTLSKRPSLYFYSRLDKPLRIEFTLVSPPNSEPLVEQTIINQRGIQQIRLPTFVELQKNKIYLWNISIPCNDVTNDYQATLTSGIERVSLSPSKTRQINNSQSNYEKFKIYVDNGIWYETLDYAEKMTRLGYNYPLNQIFSDLRIKK
jgi:hypothetical protein